MKNLVLNIIIACLASIATASAQSAFRTAELERLAATLALDVKSLPEGYSHPEAKGIRLTVHRMVGIIDHIGRQLFSDELRSHSRMPVLDFLERYFLQLKYPPKVKTANMMIRDDEFFFVTGSLATVDRIQPSDDFTYDYDQHHYRATWSRNGRTLLSVFFPVEYELISGENKIEAENNLMADVQRTPVPTTIEQANLIEDATYMSKEFSNRLYRTNGLLIISERHPVESAANMMLSLQAAKDYSISITQISYGFKKTVFSAPLQQWIAFCRNHGCELYFGVENIGDDGHVEAVVLAVNEQENYNHVLTVSVPAQAIEQRRGTVEARLYPYVPVHNMSDLFAAYRKSTPKTISQK